MEKAYLYHQYLPFTEPLDTLQVEDFQKQLEENPYFAHSGQVTNSILGYPLHMRFTVDPTGRGIFAHIASDEPLDYVNRAGALSMAYSVYSNGMPEEPVVRPTLDTQSAIEDIRFGGPKPQVINPRNFFVYPNSYLSESAYKRKESGLMAHASLYGKNELAFDARQAGSYQYDVENGAPKPSTRERLQKLSEDISKAKDRVGQKAADIGQKAANAAKASVDKFKNSKLGLSLTEFTRRVKETYQDVKQSFQRSIDTFKHMKDSVKESVKESYQTTKESFREAKDTIKANAKDAARAISHSAKESASAVKSAASKSAEAAKASFSNTWANTSDVRPSKSESRAFEVPTLDHIQPQPIDPLPQRNPKVSFVTREQQSEPTIPHIEFSETDLTALEHLAAETQQETSNSEDFNQMVHESILLSEDDFLKLDTDGALVM